MGVPPDGGNREAAPVARRPLAPAGPPRHTRGMDQEQRDYAENDRTGRGRRIDWEHGLAPVCLFVLAASVIVFGIGAYAYFGHLIPHVR